MVSIIILQATSWGGIIIPGWAMGLISLGFIIGLVPWASWVTYSIFTMKSDINASNINDRTIIEKLTAMSEDIDTNYRETKKEIKTLHSMINNLMLKEVYRFSGRSGEEKDES